MTIWIDWKKLSMMTAGVAFSALGSMGSAEAATMVRGSITKPNPQTTTVDYWDFTVNTAGRVTMNVLAYEIDFGNGLSQLNSTLYLFRNDGLLDRRDLLRNNGNNRTPAAFSDGSISHLDSYLSRFLNPGRYKLAISDATFTVPEALAGVQTDNNSLLGNGDYQITFTGDITLASVPEPTSTLGLLAFGAFGAGSILKRKQQNQE